MEAAVTDTKAQRRHFDRWAGAYGRSRLLRALQRKTLAELRAGPGDRVLDVACGAGDLLGELAPSVERAVGIDISPGMLDVARSRGPAGIEWRLGPSDDLPFESGEFTAVVCTTALHHFPDPVRSIEEMARVLAPGGRVVIGDMVRDGLVTKIGDLLLRRFEKGHVGLQRKREIAAMLTGAGLTVTRSRRVWGLLYGIVAAEKPA